MSDSGQVVPSATQSLVCGILSLFCFPFVFSVAALLLGYNAKKAITASDGGLGGDGRATVGIVLGVIGIFVWLFGGFWFVGSR